jgi:protein-S-isoprenylcysteine O-methyltransferase Ste14
MEYMNTVLFIVLTAILLAISRKSLLQPRCHGFYRFLAWECMLLLCLKHYCFWFENKFAWYQLLSWLLLFSSIFLVMSGAIQLRKNGAVTTERNDNNLLGFEKTSQLVTTGIYAYIRHPLYSSLLLLTWGLLFKQPFSFSSIALALMASGLLAITAKVEEQENLTYFGAIYTTYINRTKRFIPAVW